MIDVNVLLQHAELKPGDAVGDLGTGREARVAIAAGRMVGDNGKVYAVDVVKSILPVVANKATMHGVNNITTVWSDLEIFRGARVIADNSLAAAFMVTVLFQSHHRAEILKEAQRMLRPGGRLVVVDWKPDVHTPFGPDEERRVYPTEITKIAAGLGMQQLEAFDVGPYHWGLVFAK